MDVVERWSGRYACLLQSALRLGNEQFAARLGIAVRTVAAWHADSSVMPRREMQQLLDTAHEQAPPPAARQRFALLLAKEQAPSDSVPPPCAGTACGHRGSRPRERRPSGLPSGQRRSGGSHGSSRLASSSPAERRRPPRCARRWTRQGVHCAVRKHLGNRLHPATGVLCEYFLCEYLAGEATNSDTAENIDVMWVPRNAVPRFISVDTIFPPVLAALEEQT